MKRRPAIFVGQADHWLWFEHFKREKIRKCARRRALKGGHAEVSRRYRERRNRTGLEAYWMIGYDGPAPTPKSAWPEMIEYASVHGLRHGEAN